MPSKYDRRDAGKVGLAKAHRTMGDKGGRPPTKKASESLVTKITRARWPIGDPFRREALDVISQIRRDGLTYADLEQFFAVALMQIQQDRNRLLLDAPQATAAEAKLLDVGRKILDSKRMAEIETAPGTLRVLFSTAPDLLVKAIATLEAAGNADGAQLLTDLYMREDGIIDVDVGPGDGLVVE